jgi:hypothetical protein
MAKPILICRSNIDPKHAEVVRKAVSKQVNHDYHVIVVKTDKDTSFEVLNAENLPPITKETFDNLILENKWAQLN